MLASIDICCGDELAAWANPPSDSTVPAVFESCPRPAIEPSTPARRTSDGHHAERISYCRSESRRSMTIYMRALNSGIPISGSRKRGASSLHNKPPTFSYSPTGKTTYTAVCDGTDGRAQWTAIGLLSPRRCVHRDFCRPYANILGSVRAQARRPRP